MLRVENIKSSTSFYSKIPYNYNKYRNIIYGDNKTKVCIMFSPRAGCTITFKCYLDMMNLLRDGEYYENVHDYREQEFIRFSKEIDFHTLLGNNYNIIKTITNPYSRAVSIFIGHAYPGLSFKEFLVNLCNNDTSKLLFDGVNHIVQQYIEGEEKYISKYIKIDKYEKYDIELNDGNKFSFDVNRYKSNHHTPRVNNTNFVGNIELYKLRGAIPKSYKYFYNEEIKQMVEKYYYVDIVQYGYTFEEL